MTSWWLAWRYVAILGLLLVVSIGMNLRQWSDHRAYKAAQAAELQAAAYKAGLEVAAKLAKQKPKDDARLLQAVDRIEARVNKLAGQKRPAPLPAQCAPGQARMDAVNAGADK